MHSERKCHKTETLHLAFTHLFIRIHLHLTVLHSITFTCFHAFISLTFCSSSHRQNTLTSFLLKTKQLKSKVLVTFFADRLALHVDFACSALRMREVTHSYSRGEVGRMYMCSRIPRDCGNAPLLEPGQTIIRGSVYIQSVACTASCPSSLDDGQWTESTARRHLTTGSEQNPLMT